MRVNLFDVGQRGESVNVSAQSRINCFLEPQQHPDRTTMALYGMPGKTLFKSLGANPSRGMWAVNTLPTPVFFTLHGNTLYRINNAAQEVIVGTIGTSIGDVSMADDGTNLVLVDGTNGWYYNMATMGALTQITDGNFTASPKTVTWQDTYFIVTSGLTNQFQLSDNANPAVWPAVNINFTGAAPGNLQAGIATNSILQLFGGVYGESWQNAGFPDFPYASIPGSALEFGLASAASLFKYDNSIAGLFRNTMGEVNMSRMSGFRLERISDIDLESQINAYAGVEDCKAFSYMLRGHPFAQFNFTGANRSWVFDGSNRSWAEMKDASGDRDWGNRYCTFINRAMVADYRNGNIYRIDQTNYENNGEVLPMEVTTKHIWNEDKFLSIPLIQIDVESGVGTVSGQGENPVMDLHVSKDGGHTFRPVGFSSVGKIGEYTQRVVWRRLGRARDWVLRLRITDPAKRIVVGATAELVGAAF